MNNTKDSKDLLPQYIEINKNKKRRIIGTEKMSYDDLINEINNGEKFLVYQFFFSFIILFYSRYSDICFSKNRTVVNSIKIRYSIISSISFIIMLRYITFADFSFIWHSGKNFASIAATVLLSLWFGGLTILPLLSLIKNLRGGTDVTKDVISYIEIYRSNK